MQTITRQNLLVITSTFPRWAGDHEPPFVFELARRLTGHFAVTVLAPHAPGAKRQEQMDRIDVYRFRYAPDRFEKLAYAGGIPSRLRQYRWLILLVPVFVLVQLATTYGLVRRLKPTSVHAHWLITGGLIAALVKTFSRVPFRLLVTAHGADVYGLRHPLLLRIKRWVLRQADCVTVVSDALAGAVRAIGIDDKKIVVQGMGTDLKDTFVPLRRPPGPPTLVYAGRLVNKKGVDTLLRASALVLRSVPELHIVIAGHGPDREQLEALSEELNISASVRFSGPYQLSELPQIYASASLAVFPFRASSDGDQDGLGLAVIEAMGCGVPVVGSDIAVLDDLLVPDITALRAPVDDVEAFAQCIRVTLNQPEASLERAAAARELVTGRYDWATVAVAYAGLLDPELKQPVVPRPPEDN